MLKYLVAVLLALSTPELLECQASRTSVIKDYPFVLSVSEIDEPDSICGATLITPTCALSSAHCILSFKEDAIIVKHGNNDDKIIERKVERIIIPKHEKLRTRELIDNQDFAIMVLKEPISYDEVPTVVMDFKPVKVGDPIEIVGWSRLNREELEIDNTQVATNETCLSKVPSIEIDKFFCASYPLKQGTAGRPVLNAKGQQIAMTNYLLKSREEGSSYYVYSIRFSMPETISFLNETILGNCNGANNLPNPSSGYLKL